MSNRCELTGVGPLSGNRVSHSNIKTRTRWLPNLKKKKFHIQELGMTLTIALTARALRTVDKQGGISRALVLAKEDLLSERLRAVRSKLLKSRN